MRKVSSKTVQNTGFDFECLLSGIIVKTNCSINMAWLCARIAIYYAKLSYGCGGSHRKILDTSAV